MVLKIKKSSKKLTATLNSIINNHVDNPVHYRECDEDSRLIKINDGVDQ